MRQIEYIIVHCSATKADMDITAADIDRWHRQKGWKGCGYHYIIRRNGLIEKGRAENIAGAHCKGKNSKSIGICLIGGVATDGKTPEANYTDAQMRALQDITEQLVVRYPKAIVKGHRDFNSSKECPCFDAESWWKGVTNSDKGIFYEKLHLENKFNIVM